MSGTQNLFVLLILMIAPFVQASSSGDDFITGQSFLTVTETPQNTPTPMAASQESFGPLAMRIPGLDQTMMSVLKWIQTKAIPPRPHDLYDRGNHFGSWIDPQSDRSCFNIRGLVLIRDSQRPITVIPNDQCFVSTGLWNDAYTGRMVTQAKDLQIDHVVPLKNAYISGAFSWNWKTRCAYANFMGNKFHLLPVDGAANMAKGDQTPVQFLPPNRAFTCEYLADWLKIKMIWRLMMSEQEGVVIARLVQSAGCDLRLFQYSPQELATQRQAIAAAQNQCPNTPAETTYQRPKR